jgi:endonuclease/exonuclease/phosphatase family metal-dependent hydrolase
MLSLVIVGYALIVNRSVTNYTSPNGPKYEGSYAPQQPSFDGQLTAATWNIAFAEDIDQAIAELQNTEELRQADILMLQEMDETGTDQIARALGYNYVYYPASIHSRHDKNFGNAVLSRWPIVESSKVILPHKNPSNDQIRIATKAMVDVEGQRLPVYSVHTETFWLGPEQRKDQIEALAHEAVLTLAQDLDYAIIGGDFNTLTPDSLDALTSTLAAAGLDWVSQGAGETVARAGLSVSLDHIFASNMTPRATGAVTETEASDHYPVWAILAPEQHLPND